MPEVRGRGREELPKPEVRGGREELPHVQGAVAVWAQEGREELLHGEFSSFQLLLIVSSLSRCLACKVMPHLVF